MMDFSSTQHFSMHHQLSRCALVLLSLFNVVG
jgi:hypothetical protein